MGKIYFIPYTSYTVRIKRTWEWHGLEERSKDSLFWCKIYESLDININGNLLPMASYFYVENQHSILLDTYPMERGWWLCQNELDMEWLFEFWIFFPNLSSNLPAWIFASSPLVCETLTFPKQSYRNLLEIVYLVLLSNLSEVLFFALYLNCESQRPRLVMLTEI